MSFDGHSVAYNCRLKKSKDWTEAALNSTGKISFGTEGGLYQARLGIPAVVCGPGSIAVAHKPDEYVEVSQLAACDAFLARLVDRLAA